MSGKRTCRGALTAADRSTTESPLRRNAWETVMVGAANTLFL